ncbi:MAG TPA: hypothetical protein VJZ51_01230 [Bacilli bacterium]|nr:hypothetical protein [Bacilli bacterium]
MSKSIYEEALEIMINSFLPRDYFNKTNKLKVMKALEKAPKQEKLLGHYKDLAEVRKKLYDLTTNFKPSNIGVMIALFTQETLVSNIIKELENE